ncbi:hypothetical protein EGW08_010112 [Elysia chlorotica]|uniref:Uncharacterized protein n=1 Tax=Elysia chlorotica TaxID=188477 RepID=A0A433TKR1_ELYCH|nr:hypothetical protein EGW08_010112 [Elysia chlorotica]
MPDESVYVAIAIACVVALLLLAIMVIYCVKRQQDKMHERIIRERRLREERQRRNFMRAQMVHPPSYEASRGRDQIICPVNRDIPWSPPPEYKEVATPIPGLRHNQVVGIGGAPDLFNGAAEYNEIPSVSRNVAPAYTYMPPGVSAQANNAVAISTNNNSSNINSNNNRNMVGSRTNASTRRSDNAIQVQVSPRAAHSLPDVVTSTTGSNNSIGANNRAQRSTGQNVHHPQSLHSSQGGNVHTMANSNTNNDRSNVVSTNRTNTESNRFRTAGTQPSSTYNSHSANAPGMSDSGNSYNEAVRSPAANQETASSSMSQRAKSQPQSQFQDLSFI